MLHWRWYLLTAVLGCLGAVAPARAQLAPVSGGLRGAYALQSRWATDVAGERDRVARRVLAIGEAAVALPPGDGRRTELLAELQSLAALLRALDADLAAADTALTDLRARLRADLEARHDSLMAAARGADPGARTVLEARAAELGDEVVALCREPPLRTGPDPLAQATGPLSALARLVAEEHERLRMLDSLSRELQRFMGGLRLFDETSMPQAARGEAGGDPAGGCPVVCPISSAPADVPVAHTSPDGGASGAAPVTASSLAELHDVIAEYVEGEARRPRLSAGSGPPTWELVVGGAALEFRDQGRGLAGAGPTARAVGRFDRPVGSANLTVEPSLGSRALRAAGGTVAEVAAEAREAVAGTSGWGEWRITAWQKGRFLSAPLTPPGYLEPGRVEGGVRARLAVPLAGWEVMVEGGGDAVRYAPEDWTVLNRQGVSASTGVVWRSALRSLGVSVGGSRHGFPDTGTLDQRRADSRATVDLDAAIEGAVVVRFSAGATWNRSRLPAYDFRSAKAALVVSAPWGGGSVQGYGAVAHQVYGNPGTEDHRVAPSDHDAGSIVTVQYTRPLAPDRALMVRVGWSRSRTGYRTDFYHRLGLGVHLGFRGR